MSFVSCSLCDRPTDLLVGTVEGAVICRCCREKLTPALPPNPIAIPVQPEPAEKPSARMLRALSDLRDLSLMENHHVSDPADRHAVELARHLYATVRAVDVDKLRQRSLLEGV